MASRRNSASSFVPFMGTPVASRPVLPGRNSFSVADDLASFPDDVPATLDRDQQGTIRGVPEDHEVDGSDNGGPEEDTDEKASEEEDCFTGMLHSRFCCLAFAM